MTRVLVFFILMFFGSGLLAAELRQFGENARSNGMGGVRVAEPHRAYNFLSNPAYLGQIKGMNWDVFQLGLGTNGQKTYEDFKDFQYEGIESLSQLYGRYINVNYQGYSAVAFPNFGFAVYNQGYVEASAHNPAFPVLDMTYMNDYGLAIGGAVPLGPNLHLGLNGRRVTRRGNNLQLGASTLDQIESNEQLLEQFENEGVGYALDAGLLYTAPEPFSPSISLAWKDLGSTAFTKTKGAMAPDHQKDEVSLAVTFQGDSTLIGIAGGVEYRHINNSSEQLGKKIHAGLELNLPLVDLRAGLYQGYATYGVGIDLFLFQVDAAMYTVERGAYPGQTPDDRLQIGIGMSFSFDPDFNLTDSTGKRRRLKQRR